MVNVTKNSFGKKADRYGILWLKSSKRKGAKDKIQGKDGKCMNLLVHKRKMLIFS